MTNIPRRPDSACGQRHTPEKVRVSLWAPAGRRTLFVYSYQCPVCSAHQFGRRRALAAVTEIRKGGCGHWIEVIVGQVYDSPGAA